MKFLLSERGSEVTFRRIPKGSYDTTTGTVTSGAAQDETVLVAFKEYNQNQVDGTNVLRGDRIALMSAFKSDGTALTKRPEEGDLFVGVGDKARIISVREYLDNDVVIAYRCQVRV